MTTTLVDQIAPFLHDMKRRLRPNTLRAYHADLKLAAATLTNPLNTISQQEVETFLDASSMTKSTFARRAASLGRFFRWAVRNGHCTMNPLEGREPIRLKRRLPRPVRSRDDLKALDAAIAAAPQPYRLIFTILRETGMRVSEVLQLIISDVTLDAGREGLLVREPKNNSERVVFLGPTSTPKSLRGLRAWLREVKGHPGYAPLFRSNRGTRVSYSATQYQWTLVCQSAGLVEGNGKLRYTLHQLRHTRGSQLVEQGQPVEIIQRALGHRDIRSTQGYAELSDPQVREALESDGRR